MIAVVICFGPRLAGAVEILSSVPRADQVLLGSGESNQGVGFKYLGGLYCSLICRRTLRRTRKLASKQKMRVIIINIIM